MAEILASHLPDDSGSGNPPPTRAGFVTRVLFILFCLEIGVVLLILPWTQFWDNNYFFSLTSGLEYCLVQYVSAGWNLRPGTRQFLDRPQ